MIIINQNYQYDNFDIIINNNDNHIKIVRLIIIIKILKIKLMMLVIIMKILIIKIIITN